MNPELLMSFVLTQSFAPAGTSVPPETIITSSDALPAWARFTFQVRTIQLQQEELNRLKAHHTESHTKTNALEAEKKALEAEKTRLEAEVVRLKEECEAHDLPSDEAAYLARLCEELKELFTRLHADLSRFPQYAQAVAEHSKDFPRLLAIYEEAVAGQGDDGKHLHPE